MSFPSWQQYLRTKEKCVIFTYVSFSHLEEKNTFSYINDGEQREQVVAVLLNEAGHMPPTVEPVVKELNPSETLYMDAREFFPGTAPASFQGGLFVIISNVETGKPFVWGSKDLVTFWLNQHSTTQIGTSGFAKLNIAAEKGTKSFYLFCPAVVSSPTVKTLLSLFHFSTDEGYTEVATMTPRLHNLTGETLEGTPISVAPYGTTTLDVDALFGDAGRALLAKTGGRGSLTCIHQGHTIGTYFFHANRADGSILSGQHTQPPVPCLFFYKTQFNYWANYLGSKLPFSGHIIPLLSFVKHNRGVLKVLYPHHSKYLGTFWDWFRQSRFVVWCRFVSRATYFLVRRGFVVDEIHATERDHHNHHVIQHNLWNNFKLLQFSRGRIESLLHLLRGVPTLAMRGKTLSIGPKNEGEILLLEAHGFTDVTGIDLFTYSPKIKLMDVHRLAFPDDTFDTITCGWVINYFYDLQKAVNEIVRVAKDGAIFVCSFGVNKDGTEDLAFINTHLFGGIKELLPYFGDRVGHIYWWSEESVGDKSNVYKVIFSIRKSPVSAPVTMEVQHDHRHMAGF